MALISAQPMKLLHHLKIKTVSPALTTHYDTGPTYPIKLLHHYQPVLTTHYGTGLTQPMKLLHHPKTVCRANEHHDTTSPQAIKLFHHYQTALSALTKHHGLAPAQTHPIKLSHHHQPVLTTHYCTGPTHPIKLLHHPKTVQAALLKNTICHTSSSCCITTKQLHQHSQNTMDMV